MTFFIHVVVKLTDFILMYNPNSLTSKILNEFAQLLQSIFLVCRLICYYLI